MSEFVTTCTGSTCGARIVFSDGPTGKRHPYDFPPKTCEACDGVGHRTETQTRSMFEGGGTHTVREPCKPCKGKGRKYVSHYETCHNKDEFRKKKAST